MSFVSSRLNTLGVGCARGLHRAWPVQGHGPCQSWSRRCPSRRWLTFGSRCSCSGRSAFGGAFAQPRGGGLSAALCVSPGCLSSDSHSLPFSCAAAQTCSTCTASQFQRCLWPAWIGRSRGVGTGYGLDHQELPTGPASPVAPVTRLSRSPRCLSRVAAIRRCLWTLCTLCSGLRGPSCHGVCVQLR